MKTTRWFYYLWEFAFTSGRIYGKKPASYQDERPLYIFDMKRFLSLLQQEKAPRWLLNELKKEIKLDAD